MTTAEHEKVKRLLSCHLKELERRCEDAVLSRRSLCYGRKAGTGVIYTLIDCQDRMINVTLIDIRNNCHTRAHILVFFADDAYVGPSHMCEKEREKSRSDA